MRKEHLKKFKELVKKTRELSEEWQKFCEKQDFDVEVMLKLTKACDEGEERVWAEVYFDPRELDLSDYIANCDLYVTQMWSHMLGRMHRDVTWDTYINIKNIMEGKLE